MTRNWKCQVILTHATLLFIQVLNNKSFFIPAAWGSIREHCRAEIRNSTWQNVLGTIRSLEHISWSKVVRAYRRTFAFMSLIVTSNYGKPNTSFLRIRWKPENFYLSRNAEIVNYVSGRFSSRMLNRKARTVETMFPKHSRNGKPSHTKFEVSIYLEPTQWERNSINFHRAPLEMLERTPLRHIKTGETSRKEWFGRNKTFQVFREE